MFRRLTNEIGNWSGRNQVILAILANPWTRSVGSLLTVLTTIGGVAYCDLNKGKERLSKHVLSGNYKKFKSDLARIERWPTFFAKIPNLDWMELEFQASLSCGKITFQGKSKSDTDWQFDKLMTLKAVMEAEPTSFKESACVNWSALKSAFGNYDLTEQLTSRYTTKKTLKELIGTGSGKDPAGLYFPGLERLEDKMGRKSFIPMIFLKRIMNDEKEYGQFVITRVYEALNRAEENE